MKSMPSLAAIFLRLLLTTGSAGHASLTPLPWIRQVFKCVENTLLHLKGNIGKSLIGAALVEELVSLGDGAGDFPLPVPLVRVQVDGCSRGRQVHLTRVVGPSTEYQLTHLQD